MRSNIMKLYYTTFTWEQERFYVAATERGLAYVGVDKRGRIDLERWQQKQLQTATLINDDERLAHYVAEIVQFLHKKRTTFSFPLDIYGTPFQRRVWEQLLNIPYGKLTNYKTISERMNKRT